MMQMAITSGVGAILGLLSTFGESYLVKDFDEIDVEKKWPRWLVPLICACLCFVGGSVAKEMSHSLFYSVFICALVMLACFDIKYMLLPTKVILPSSCVAFIWLIYTAITTHEWAYLINGLLGAMVGYGLFLLIFYGSKWFLHKEGLGFGDVRLMIFIGAVVGLDQLFIVIIIASLLAVLFGGVLLMIRKESKAFAFGPFLCIGTLIMLLFGHSILLFYFRCLGI